MQTSIRELIPEIDKVHIELPLICWAESAKKDKRVEDILLILLRVYRLTNNCYDNRFADNKKENELTRYLEIIERYANSDEKNDHVLKLIGIVKANILLRRGQVKANSFKDPTGDYQKACNILEQLYMRKDPDHADFLEFLAQLNLGKYFRNMGMYKHRSDYYWKAFDEFENLLEKVVNRPDGNISTVKNKSSIEPWRVFIWLEAAMNLSRTELYLYNLKDAKIHLWNIYNKTAIEKKELDESIQHIFDNGKVFGGRLDLSPQNELYSILEDNMSVNIGKECKYIDNKEMLNQYSIQSLIQLGIVFRKTRDYVFAWKIFDTVLLTDKTVETNNDTQVYKYNVDALNNYAVCLRKSGFRFDEKAEEKEKGKEGKTEDFLSTLPLEKFNWQQKEHVVNLYYSLLHCLRKGKNDSVSICEMYKSFTDRQRNEYQDQDEDRNRFATIEYIRAFFCEGNWQNTQEEKISKLLDSLLNKNPGDMEVQLQKGLFLQKKEKYTESSEIFQKLYSESPQIGKGTIGLKAYYNLGCNFLAEGKPYEAVKYFVKIKNEVPYIPPADRQILTDENQIYLEDLPGNDLLAEINEAWCLMIRGDYEKARLIYANILESYHGQIDRLGLHNEMKIRNNLVECCLQLLAYYSKFGSKTHNVEPGDYLKLLKNIEECFDRIDDKESQNPIAMRHRGYYHLLWGKLCKEDSVLEFEEAMEQFEKAGIYRSDDVYIYSGWVSAAYEWYKAECQSNRTKVFERVGKRLRYISGPYAIKSCAKLSEILSYIDTELEWPQAEKDTLFRSVARIQLSPKEEGYNLFQDLRENELFCGLSSVERGRLLVILFQIYGKIMEIKDICRYNPSMEGKKPVHYRSISRLKRYLNDSEDQKGRFSLWNVAYMNDYQEGASFNTILQSAAKNVKIKSCEDIHLIDKIIEYHSQFGLNRTGQNLLPFGEKNIYITSFSLQADAIPMWVAYADNAKGCALTYSEEFLGLRHMDDFLTDVSSYSGNDFPLYKVHYIDCEKNTSSIEVIQKIEENTAAVIEFVLLLQKCLKKEREKMLPLSAAGWRADEGTVTVEDVIKEFVGGCLNEVRFLVKDSEYASEDEVRMIHYSKDHHIETRYSRIPRFYIEIDRDVSIDEVILGPKISEYDQREIEIWLNSTGRVKRVTKSKRHYR